MAAPMRQDLDAFGYSVIKKLSEVLIQSFDAARLAGEAEARKSLGSLARAGLTEANQVERFTMQCHGLTILEAMKVVLDLHLTAMPEELRLDVEEHAGEMLARAISRGAEPLASEEYWEGFLEAKAALAREAAADLLKDLRMPGLDEDGA